MQNNLTIVDQDLILISSIFYIHNPQISSTRRKKIKMTKKMKTKTIDVYTNIYLIYKYKNQNSLLITKNLFQSDPTDKLQLFIIEQLEAVD